MNYKTTKIFMTVLGIKCSNTSPFMNIHYPSSMSLFPCHPSLWQALLLYAKSQCSFLKLTSQHGSNGKPPFMVLVSIAFGHFIFPYEVSLYPPFERDSSEPIPLPLNVFKQSNNPCIHSCSKKLHDLSFLMAKQNSFVNMCLDFYLASHLLLNISFFSIFQLL